MIGAETPAERIARLEREVRELKRMVQELSRRIQAGGL